MFVYVVYRAVANAADAMLLLLSKTQIQTSTGTTTSSSSSSKSQSQSQSGQSAEADDPVLTDWTPTLLLEVFTRSSAKLLSKQDVYMGLHHPDRARTLLGKELYREEGSVQGGSTDGRILILFSISI